MPKRHVENYDDDLPPPELIQRLERFRAKEQQTLAKIEALETALEQQSDKRTAELHEEALGREERALYLTVLHAGALQMGFKSLAPLDSEQYAAAVFSRVPHVCAFDLSKHQLGNFTSVTCNIVSPSAGGTYYDPVSQQNYPISGNVVMCSFSGKTHRCIQGKFCSKTALSKHPSAERVLESVLYEVQVQRLFLINDLACEANWPIVDITEVGEYAQLLFGRMQQLMHSCILDPDAQQPAACPLFYLEHGESYRDPYEPERMLFSSGTVQLCKTSGYIRVNAAGSRVFFAKTFPQLKSRMAEFFRSCNRSRDHGYVCLLTNQFKQNIIDQTPVPEKDEKISLRKLEIYSKSQKDREEAADDEVGEEYDDDNEPPEDEAVIDEKERLESYLAEQKAGTKEVTKKKLAKRAAKDDLDANRSEDEEEEQPEVQPEQPVSEAPELLQLGPLEPPMRPPPKPMRKATSLVAEGEGADEANGRRAHSIAVLITSNHSRALLFEDLMKGAAAKAHEKLKQMQRQARFSALPVLEQRRYWSIVFFKELPLAMPAELDPLPLGEYVAVILRCWNRLVLTPFVVEDVVNKRTQATFAKTVISSLYCMADGGYEVNCSFGLEERKAMGLLFDQLPPHLARLEKRVKVYPNAKRLAPYLVDKGFLTQLSGLLGGKIRFNDGIIGRGREFLDACYSSLILRKKQQVINEVNLCTTPREAAECILSYFKFCSSLQCWEQKEPQPPQQQQHPLPPS
jgi:hypothetical protein